MQVLPLVNDTVYTFQITIEQSEYIFDFIWNNIFEYYTFNITNVESGVTFYGLKLVLNTEFIRIYNNPNLPNGALIAVNTEGMEIPITPTSFQGSGTIRLVFVPEEELD